MITVTVTTGGGPCTIVRGVLAEPVQFETPVAVAVKLPGAVYEYLVVSGNAPLSVVEVASPKASVRLPQVPVPETVNMTDWPTWAEEGVASKEVIVPGGGGATVTVTDARTPTPPPAP